MYMECFSGINFGTLEGVDADGRHWKFEGQIFDGQPEGGGLMTWDNGDSYEGDFHLGERHGNGVFNSKNGTIYKGNNKQYKYCLIRFNLVELKRNIQQMVT